MKKLILFLLLTVGTFAQNTDPGYGYYRNTALTNSASGVKGGAANLFGYTLINVNTVPVYVKFYNGAQASVTIGTTVPRMVIMVPPGDGTSPGVVYLSAENVSSAFFPFGLTVGAVTGLADNNTSAPSTAIYVEVLYK